ncbi:MAG: thioredoxin family protein [Bacteroidia bacterium]
MKKILLSILVVFAVIACSTAKNSSKEANDTEITETSASIEWQSTKSMSHALELAKESGKPILIDVSTDWCGYCKKMKKNVYTDAAVISKVTSDYIPLALNGEKGEGIAFVKQHRISGYPTQIILDKDGKVINRHVGYTNAEGFLAFIK